MDNLPLTNTMLLLEALLFAASEPLSLNKIAFYYGINFIAPTYIFLLKFKNSTIAHSERETFQTQCPTSIPSLFLKPPFLPQKCSSPPHSRSLRISATICCRLWLTCTLCPTSMLGCR